jgi:hypothetical protein
MNEVTERSRRAVYRPMRRLLALLLVSACAPLATTPSPRGLSAILVLPVDNRTGNPLYADAPPLLLGVLRDTPEPPRVTAADILTDELRRELSRRGFRVLVPEASAGMPAVPPVRSVEQAEQWASGAGVETPVLYVSLSRWDATAMSHVLYVDVALDATLVQPDGRVLWTSRLPARPIDGGGASSVSLAYPAVARRVAELVIADLRPAASPS